MKKKVSQSARLYGRHNLPLFLTILWISLVIVLGIGLCARSATAEGETESDMEYRIKAAFLFNFCKFVSWPDSPLEKADGPLIFYIIGENPFKIGLETLAGKAAKGRPLEIHYASNVEAIGPCHLVFIGKSEQKESAAIIARVKNKPILTVGDMGDFARQGGIIAFVKIENKIRFEINPKAAAAAGLKISSQLLKLAIISDDALVKEN